MRITKDKCNQCGVETIDRYDHIGWIHFSGDFTISTSLGRDKDRVARTKSSRISEMDFCSLSCMVAYITGRIKWTN